MRTPALIILLFLLLLPLILFSGFFQETAPLTEQAGERISTGPGPEDMVLDTLHGAPRLLVSCTGRRESHTPYGEIEAISLPGSGRTILPRLGEPADLVFRPHGICLEGDLLYVISHEREPDVHPVLIYRVAEKQLEFIEQIDHPLLNSPNALVAGPGGELYVVNDSGKRGSMTEKIFRLKKAGVIRLKKDTGENWEAREVASGLSYPAGINRIGKTLFVGDAIQHRIHTFSITADTLLPGKGLEGLKGNDNIRTHGNDLLTTGHLKQFRFIRHVNDPGNPSPVAVYRADPVAGTFRVIYRTDGTAISAGSTAIIHGDHLYISQIFEPYILRVERPD